MSASTRADVKIIEASENIRYLGQKISRDYLYFYQNPEKIDIKEQLYEDIKLLEESIQDISAITKSQNSKNILSFLTYNKNSVKKLIDKSIDRQNTLLMLDYSESLLEGANSIEDLHRYNFSAEEKILMSLKNIEYLLQRISKYYIAYTLNINKDSDLNSMNIATEEIDKILKKINSYDYPKKVYIEVKNINSNWIKYKRFLGKIKELKIPNLILISTLNFEKGIKKIVLYHRQNQ
jgi:hypothetical protein